MANKTLENATVVNNAVVATTNSNLNGGDNMLKETSVAAVLEAVSKKNCVIANFSGQEITDAEAWYKTTRNMTQITFLNLRSNPKHVIDALINASTNKGGYANMAVVVCKNGQYKVPHEVFNFTVTEENNKKDLQDLIDFGAMVDELKDIFGNEFNFESLSASRTERLVAGVQADMTNVMTKWFEDMAFETIAREDAKLKAAEQERLFKLNRSKIYNTATGEFEAYSMHRAADDNTNWIFNKEEVKMALSELLRALITEYNLDYVMTRNLVKHYSFKQIIQLNFENDFKQASDFKRIYKTPDNDLYVSTACLASEKDEELDFSSETDNGYRCLTNYIVMDTLPEGSVEYINVAHGASGIRKNSSFYLLNDGKIEDVLNRASRGIYKAFKGKMLSISKTVKANTRIMASAAPSQVLYEVNAFAILVGKFGMGDKNNIYSEEFTGLKGTLDGIVYSLFYAMQARLGSSKSFASQVTKRLMQLMIRFFDANPIVLEVGKEATEEQKAIITAAFGDKKVMINGVMTDLSNRVVICKKADSDTVIPEYFGDLNSFKADFDIARGFEVPVLDMPVRNSANASTQFLSKVIAAGGKKAVDLITNRLKAHFDTLLEGLTDDAEISIKDLKDPFVSGIIGKAVPEYMKLDVSVRRQTANLVLNSIAKALNRMRFPISESANGRAIPDVGALFGTPILKDDEFYTIDIKSGKDCIIIKYPTIGEREFWKARTVSYKEICERIDAFEIPEALKGFGNDFRTEVKTYFKHMAAGCAVMPANKAIMAGLAGMDFDYDMVIAIYDEEFVNIFKDVKPGVIHIMNPSQDNSVAKEFSFMTMSDPQLALIAKDAPNVGGVTNNYNIPMQFDLFCRYYEESLNVLKAELENQPENTTLQNKITKKEKAIEVLVNTFATLVDYAFIEADKAAEMLKDREKITFPEYNFNGKAPRIASLQKRLEKFNDRSNGKVYTAISENWSDPMYGYLPVSKAQKEKAEEQMRTCCIKTLKDVRAICADINRIARSDQETTIDSAKTSVTANIQLNFSTFSNVFSKVEYAYEIDRETNQITRFVKRPNSDYGKLGKKYYIYDIFSMIRDDVEAYIIPKVQDFISNYSYSEEELANLLPSYEGVQGLSACIEMANLYGRISFNNAEQKDVLAKADLDNYYKAIHHTVKLAADPILNKSANSFGKFVCWLSMYGNGSNGKIAKKINKTSFNATCFPIETLYFAYKLSHKLARVCEPITCIESAIEVDSIYEFINGNAYNEEGRLIAVAKEFINGEFKIMDVNGKLMACDKVSHYLDRNAYDKNYVAFSLKGAHEELTGDITFDAAAMGEYSSRNNAKVVIDGTVYNSSMYEALKVIKSLNQSLTVAHSYVIGDSTIVLAKVGEAIEVLEDNIVEAYVPDADYMPTEEEMAAIMSFNANDYGFENSDLGLPSFDNVERVEFDF